MYVVRWLRAVRVPSMGRQPKDGPREPIFVNIYTLRHANARAADSYRWRRVPSVCREAANARSSVWRDRGSTAQAHLSDGDGPLGTPNKVDHARPNAATVHAPRPSTKGVALCCTSARRQCRPSHVGLRVRLNRVAFDALAGAQVFTDHERVEVDSSRGMAQQIKHDGRRVGPTRDANVLHGRCDGDEQPPKGLSKG